jgi:hypothetical protein
MIWRLENSIRLRLKQFCSFGKLNDSEDILRDWENIQENFKNSAKESLGPCEFMQHKSRFGEECLCF